MSPTLKIFTKSGCPWCLQATAWLSNEGYRFQEIDVISDDDAFAEMKSLSGQTFAPTLIVEEDGDEDAGKDDTTPTILADFDVDELKQFLKAEGIKPRKA